MPTTRRVQVTGTLGLFLLGAPLLCLAWLKDHSPADPLRRPVAHSTRQRSPSEEARREGWRYWRRAQEAVNQERVALENWDPQASGTRGQEVWRRQLMARDGNGDLRRARAAAQRAAALAGTNSEAREAALLRARIEWDLGDHETECAARGVRRSGHRWAVGSIKRWSREMHRRMDSGSERAPVSWNCCSLSIDL